MKNNLKLIATGTVATLAMGVALIFAPSVKAQTFTSATSGSAVRSAFSTVTVGGAATSYAIEVLQPKNVYSGGDTGAYDLTLVWQGTGALTTNPDGAVLSQATLNTGAPTELTTKSFEGAVAGAIQSATTDKKYENVEAIIDKFVSGPGVTVNMD